MRPIIVFLTGALAAWLWFDSGAALAENFGVRSHRSVYQ